MPKVNEALAPQIKAVEDAIDAYEKALSELQANCEHQIVLKYENSDYLTTRICEECGYYERVQWDSGYRYKDQRLLKRAYNASREDLSEAHAKLYR